MPRPVKGNHDGAVVSGFFISGIPALGYALVIQKTGDGAPVQGQAHLPRYGFRTPHDSKHLHGWRGRKHRATDTPDGYPPSLFARDWTR
jgi:hypothetical protein